ncbi:MAG: OmpP1/FadL family transporter [Desulfamplus sp.]
MLSKLSICLSLLLVFCCTPNLSADTDIIQDVDIPSSFNPLGSGARAIGMGGAFIGVADDATAASWNPGGLIQLEEPEISLVYSYTQRHDDKKFRTEADLDNSNKNEVDFSRINYFSLAYPFQKGDRNMVVSLNFQHLYDLNYKGRFINKDIGMENIIADQQPEDNQEISISEDSPATDYDITQDGNIYALGLAAGGQITPHVSVGATVNYWGDTLADSEWSNCYISKYSMNYPFFRADFIDVKSERFSFEGWNVNLGILWQINYKWSLGSVFKSPFTADIVHFRNIKSTTNYLSPDGTVDNAAVSRDENISFDEEMDMPASYGAGFAYRYSDKLTLSGEIYRTHWENFKYTKHNGITISPITGEHIDEADIDPTTWCRLGGEYLIIGDKFVVPLRAGLFYDPAPASGSADNYYGFSLGSGISYKKLVFDAAFTYRFGNDVGTDIFNIEDVGFSQDVYEYKIYASIIVHL